MKMTQEEINVGLFDEVKKLRTALFKIANYDEEPIWFDDRDDAANDMLRIARVSLGLEEE